MLRLYLLRHAKSSWALPGVSDHDRALNDRGRRDLPTIGKMLAERNYVPEAIICSTATRTRATLEGILPFLPNEPVVSSAQSLYASGTEEYLRLIQNAPDCASLMLIGHNPMCDEIARELIEGGNEEAMAELQTHYPTGALTVLDFELEDWSEVKYGTANLIDFVKPRDLHA